MSQLTQAVRRSPRRARLTAAAVLVALAALMLVWIGRASADQGGRKLASVSSSVSNVPTSRADAVDFAGFIACTVSPAFNDMPEMSKTFRLGGRVAQPVIVLFQGQWGGFTSGAAVQIRLTIDGVPGSGLTINERPSGEPNVVETHGYNFVSEPLAPGTHTATIQWADNGAGPSCIGRRSLIILHK